MILEHLDELTTRAVSSGGRRAAMWWLDESVSAYRVRFEWYPDHNDPDSPWHDGRSSDRFYSKDEAQQLAARWCDDGELPMGIHPRGGAS